MIKCETYTWTTKSSHRLHDRLIPVNKTSYLVVSIRDYDNIISDTNPAQMIVLSSRLGNVSLTFDEFKNWPTCPSPSTIELTSFTECIKTDGEWLIV